MEYLQYERVEKNWLKNPNGFKPYYKWNTFNTIDAVIEDDSVSGTF